MIISEVIEHLNGDWRVDTLAKHIGIPEKRLRRALREAEYKYNNSTRHWSFVGKGVAPESTDIAEFVGELRGVGRPPIVSQSGSQGRSQGRNKDREQVSETDSLSGECIGERHSTNPKGIPSPLPSPLSALAELTPQQIDAIIELANERIHEAATESKRVRLHKRVMALDTQSKTRKTIVIDEQVAERFDRFAERIRFNKSDIMALALVDFISAYDVQDDD